MPTRLPENWRAARRGTRRVEAGANAPTGNSSSTSMIGSVLIWVAVLLTITFFLVLPEIVERVPAEVLAATSAIVP